MNPPPKSYLRVLLNSLRELKMSIDVHVHYFPPKYLEALKKRKTSPVLEKDELGRPIIVDRGVRIVTITEEMSNIEKRLKDMDKGGMDMQILSMTTPSVYSMEPKDSIAFARLVNDETSAIAEKYPDRFAGMATLPFNDIDGAMDELDRAVNDLGMKGVVTFSNLAGKTLDSPELWPIYDKISRMGVPLFMHPFTPLAGDIFKDYRLAPMIGFPFDTSLGALRMIFSGVFVKYPSLKLILAHLGGTLPYLLERLDFCYRAYPECKVNISRPPSEFLRNMYYDTVTFYQPALNCAYDFVGTEKMLMGSDYPHVIGDLPRAITSIRESAFTEEEKKMILGENARKLFSIK
jgi:aminocarboxymuconate-semialdehyde decarboxylase